VRTALTITALRRVTQRFVSGGGKSVVLDGVSPPSELYNLILSFMGAF
jgi:hypothetical protein